MILQFLMIPTVVLVLLTSSALLMIRDWRWSLAILFVQYLGVFILVAAFGLLELALTKVMAGWIASAVLALALAGAPSTSFETGPEGQADLQRLTTNTPSSRLFRLLAVGIIGLVASSIAPSLVSLAPGLRLAQAWGALLLVSAGLLHLGLTTHPFKVIIGLLTVLSGFEILYAAVETSALVTGLLAAVNLGLALAGAYLLAAPTITEEG